MWGLPPIAANFAGGTNFAAGGACTGATSVHQPNSTDLPTQFAAFARQVPAPIAGALYTVDIGINDISAIFDTVGMTPVAIQAAANQAITNTSLFIDSLAGAGVLDLLLITIPDMSRMPGAAGQSPTYLQELRTLDSFYNTQLLASARALALKDGFRLTVIDLFTLTDALVANPGAFGFANATAPCWTGSSDALDGTLCAPILAGQDQYAFWDHGHPSARSHAIIAALVAIQLNPVPAATR